MAYLYCPNCGNNYTKKEIEKFKRKPLMIECTNCGFVFYNNPKPTAIALIKDKSGRILLVRRAIKPYLHYWCLPGGFINYREDPKVALKRELKEELDAEFEIGDILTAYHEYYYNHGKRNERYSLTVLIFSAKILSETKFIAKDDIQDFKFFSRDKFPSKIAFLGLKKFLKLLVKNK